MRALLVLSLVIFSWSPVWAGSEQAERLAKAMRMVEVIHILRDEGLAQSQELDDALLAGAGGSHFRAQIEDIYDPVWMYAQVTSALEEDMTDAQLEQASLFFESDLGQTIVSLENSARLAISDEAIEDMARLAYREADREAGFFRLIDEYVALNDLIDRNVQSQLSADYKFFRGLADGQGVAADDSDILAEILAQSAETEEHTREWLYAFLLMAYRPLSEAQLRETIAFSRTEAGRALNTALFNGLHEMFGELSYQLGQTAARVLSASDL